MKTILSICLAVLALTGCISIVQPPESSHNGLYLQIFDTTSGFIAQENMNGEAECAFMAANVPKWSRGKLNVFCTKTNHPLINTKATIKYQSGAIHDILFTSLDACGKYLIENAKAADVQVLNFCQPAKI